MTPGDKDCGTTIPFPHKLRLRLLELFLTALAVVVCYCNLRGWFGKPITFRMREMTPNASDIAGLAYPALVGCLLVRQFCACLTPSRPWLPLWRLPFAWLLVGALLGHFFWWR